MKKYLAYLPVFYRIKRKKWAVLFILLGLFPVAWSQSPYTVEVNIPPYDSTNREHFLIKTQDDWSHINDPGKRFFYVEPNGNYGQVRITADGTEDSMRYISLYNGNDLHPAMLNPGELANVRLEFWGAHYWVVDRMSSIGYNAAEFCYEIKENSSHIVLNRFFLSGFFAGIIVRGTNVEPYTHDISIQNSRLDPMSPEGIDGDAVAILLEGHTWNTPGRVKDTRIINNEIRNCNDGIMLLKMPQFEGNGTYWVDYPGTIIDHNYIYVDTAVYTDGQGNHDPNGKWAWTENAVDLKGGSDDPDNPVVVSNNYFWGYRRTDQNGGGSGSWGAAFGAHYHVKNLVIRDNVIFNSNRAIAFSGLEGTPLTAEDVVISGNIFYDIGYNTDGNTGYCNVFFDAKDVSFAANTIVGVNKKSYWMDIGSEKGSPSEFVDVSCNVIINSENETGVRGAYNQFHDNYFYNTAMIRPEDGTFYAFASQAHMEDLTFTKDHFTNAPDTITLPGVVTTDESPHASGCFSSSLGTPSCPNPPDQSENVAADASLEWIASYGANGYDVFLGTSNPPGFYAHLTSAFTEPGYLDDTTTYYWQVIAMNDSDTIAGPVWQFRTGISGMELENLALYKPVTCSSQENEFHGAQKLVDDTAGVFDNRWSAGPMPQWAEVDLGKNDTLMKTELVCFMDRAYQFKIECREDGDTAYQLIVDRLDNTQRGSVDYPVTDIFPKTVARYVRLTVVGADTSTYDGTWASISEFRVLGKEGVTTFTPVASQEPGFFVRNYPNPFRDATTIFFHLPLPGEVTIKIFDISGKEIFFFPRVLLREGDHSVVWNAGKYHNGLYYYLIRYNGQTRSGKMVLGK